MKVYQILIITLFFLNILAFSAVDAGNVKLTSLMCYQDTAEIGPDEVIVEIYANDRLIESLGPEVMYRSSNWFLNHDISNPNNYDVRIKLKEDDPQHDDEIGVFTIRPEPTGVFTRDLPDIIASEGTTHYKLSYEVTDESTPIQPYYVKIESVKCNDAQEAKDEIEIFVNGEMAWNADNFKTGQTRNTPSDYIQVTSPVKIDVFEDDGIYDDHIGTYEFDITRDMLRTTQSHTFSRDSGITGDAKYTVSFFVGS